MMLKIRVSAEITQDVVITWSPEYGAQLLGQDEHVTIEEIEPREQVNVPVLNMPTVNMPRPKSPSRALPMVPMVENDQSPGECLMCGCPGPHEPEQCPHVCLRYVEAL